MFVCYSVLGSVIYQEIEKVINYPLIDFLYYLFVYVISSKIKVRTSLRPLLVWRGVPLFASAKVRTSRQLTKCFCKFFAKKGYFVVKNA